MLPRLGIEVSFVDTSDPGKVKEVFKANTKMVFLETPANPTMTVCDIAEIAAMARERGALSVVDNTFATPYFQRPLQLGADVSLSSCTKYIGGHRITSYNVCYTKLLRPMQLVLAGGSATDDPEGEIVIKEVRRAAGDDERIKILLLPPDSHREINALQRSADIVLQKSIREGFGLTVSEAMWKRKPVIGGDTGGIRLQVINHYTGFLVRSPEGAALRIRYLLHRKERIA